MTREQFKPVPVRGFGVLQLSVGFFTALLGLFVAIAPHIEVAAAKDLLVTITSDMSGIDGRIGSVLYYGAAAAISFIGVHMMRTAPVQ